MLGVNSLFATQLSKQNPIHTKDIRLYQKSYTHYIYKQGHEVKSCTFGALVWIVTEQLKGTRYVKLTF